jgi:hypothetical protein
VTSQPTWLRPVFTVPTLGAVSEQVAPASRLPPRLNARRHGDDALGSDTAASVPHVSDRTRSGVRSVLRSSVKLSC